jgi:hypothetical protein
VAKHSSLFALIVVGDEEKRSIILTSGTDLSNINFSIGKAGDELVVSLSNGLAYFISFGFEYSGFRYYKYFLSSLMSWKHSCNNC